jgi:predicted dehydrogenase/nucleoside-diphosphate-sugar epimerase
VPPPKETALHQPPIRVAFVGAGHIASLHLRALRRVGVRHAVVGVYDVNPSKAQALASQACARAYGELDTLLADARPDLVHICTPAGSHFEPARRALLAGAHVYVEKPFVETLEEAETLLRLARGGGRLICPGHQLLRDSAFLQLMRGARDLMPVALVDSHFAFRPPRVPMHRAHARALAAQLLDILPHPLCTLVAGLEQCTPMGTPLEIVAASAPAGELHALIRAGSTFGRLFVSLRARPVASTLTLTGTRGARTADFVRSIVVGAGNDGTTPLEKILNPFLEGVQLTWRSAAGVARRIMHRGDYPGLAELLADFYGAVASCSRAPVSLDHLRRVITLYEELAGQVRRSIATPAPGPGSTTALHRGVDTRTAIVTGASGFFGAAIARELASRGFRVRGIGRSDGCEDPNVHEWVRADLSRALPADALRHAALVVHAAAETTGGFDDQRVNTVETTRNLLGAMVHAGVRRLVHISSISVLRPPASPWEVQDENTPLAEQPETLGAYTWGKCLAETAVATAHTRGEIEAHIIRPGALISAEHVEFPGLLGRRLFGSWYLACGRPGLPLAVCDVQRAAAVVAWSAEQFEDAPQVLNLFDPAIETRGQLLEVFRRRGWRGRLIWVPVPLLASGLTLARVALGLARLQRPQRLRVWAVLRHRRYDPALSARALHEVRRPAPPPVAVGGALAAGLLTQAHG